MVSNYKLIIKSFAIVLICFLAIFQSQAQNTDIKYIDVVYLNNGSEFRGKLIEYKHDEYLKIEILGGQIITFPAEQVEKVVQENLTNLIAPPRSRKEYAFKEKGVYNETYLNLPQGNNIWGWWELGMGLHHVVGYQHNRWIGTGIGIGFDGYSMGNAYNVIPVYAEARGYFSKKKISPFYSLNLGYGIGVKNTNQGIFGAKGGIMVNPSLGYRFGGHPNANFTLAMGYKFQKVSYEYMDWWDSFPVEQNFTFKRINLKLGMLF